jgi:hypothetical protein
MRKSVRSSPPVRSKQAKEAQPAEPKGQVWSMDLVIAVIIFLLAIGIVLFFTNTKSQTDTTRLRSESLLIADTLIGAEESGVTTQGAVDEDRLVRVIDKSVTNYEDLKQEIGLRDDFCIVFLDQNNNVIVLGNETRSVIGIGNSNLSLNLTSLGRTYRCGEPFT